LSFVFHLKVINLRLDELRKFKHGERISLVLEAHLALLTEASRVLVFKRRHFLV
jgi:hypothetical protein